MESPPIKRASITRNDDNVSVIFNFLKMVWRLIQQNIPNEILDIIFKNLYETEGPAVISLLCKNLHEFTKILKKGNIFTLKREEWGKVFKMLRKQMTEGTPNVSFVNWFMYLFDDIVRW